MEVLAALVGILAPLVSVLAWYLRKKLKLSETAADAVGHVSSTGGVVERPGSVDQAITILARRLDEQASQISVMAVYIPRLAEWGRRGWEKAPPPREPMPPYPAGIDLPK